MDDILTDPQDQTDYSDTVKTRLKDAGYTIRFSMLATDPRYAHVDHETKTIELSSGEVNTGGVTSTGELLESRVRQIIIQRDFIVSAVTGVPYKDLRNEVAPARPAQKAQNEAALAAVPV